jgi:thioredoxin-related protein
MKHLLLALILSLVCNVGFGYEKIYIFSADWCRYCQYLKKYIKDNPSIIQEEDFITVIDVDDYPELKRKYNVGSLPTTIIFDEDNKELSRKTGFSSNSWSRFIKEYTH